MTNSAKGFVVLGAAVFLIVLFVFLVWRTVLSIKNQKKLSTVKLAFFSLIVLVLVVSIVPYARPYDITIEPERIASVKVLEKVNFEKDFSSSWYCVYKIDGLFGTEESYRGLVPQVAVEPVFPEMDLDRYTYLYSLGREVKELYYNVWDSRGKAPFDLGTTNKWGKVTFSDGYAEDLIYVYRFPKVAVDNIIGTKYA